MARFFRFEWPTGLRFGALTSAVLDLFHHLWRQTMKFKTLALAAALAAAAASTRCPTAALAQAKEQFFPSWCTAPAPVRAQRRAVRQRLCRLPEAGQRCAAASTA
jgi:hypothetical protein